MSAEEFIEWFLEADILESSVCAIDSETGEPVGFQTTSHFGDIPADWVDIGTFVKSGLHQSGIGSAFSKQLWLGSMAKALSPSTPPSAPTTPAALPTTALVVSKITRCWKLCHLLMGPRSTGFVSGLIWDERGPSAAMWGRIRL